jgi:hypothetical protein
MIKARGGVAAVFVCLALFGVGGCPAVPDPAAYQSGCGSDDARVGQTAEFVNTFIHNVHGTARIVDNCTIVIENFTYDGIGLDVRVVGIANGDASNPTVLTADIRRPGGYNNETLTVPLPEGVTLDDCDQLSIMCIPFKFSFGYATFE